MRLYQTRASARALALGLAAVWTAPALAQSSDDVIEVTSLRAETEAERQPARIDIITRADIELVGAVSLVEALESAPGLSVIQSGPAGSQTSVFLRGTNSKHVLALYDGLRLNDPSSANGAFDFGSDLLGDAGRIEIVRGPLSSLYGSHAIGGVINILPRRGEGPVRAYGEFGLGAFNTVRGLAGVSGGDEHGDFNLSIERMDSDGFNVTPERIAAAGSEDDGSTFITLSGAASRALSNVWRVEILARLRAAEVDFDTFSGGLSGFQRADDPDLRTESDQSLVAGGLVRDAGALSSRLRVAHIGSELDAFDAAGLTDTYDGDRTLIQLLNAWRPQAASGFLRPVISFGAELQREDITTDTAFNAPLSVTEDAAAIFVAGQAGLGERLDFSASLRLDDYEEFGGQATGHIGAVWRLGVADARVTASYGTAFKAPSLSERFASSNFVTPNPDLEPESSESWELGVEGALPVAGRARALLLGARVYRTEIDDLIENVFDFTTSKGINQNIDAAEIDGAEIFAEWFVNERVSLALDYAWTDAVNADTGARLLRRPTHIWTARAQWRPVERAALRLSWSAVADRRDVLYNDAGFFVTNNGRLDGYERVDVSGLYDLTDRVQAFASVRNAFDETYEEPAAFAAAPRATMIGLRLRR